MTATRITTAGQTRPHEVTPRHHRRDNAWRDMVQGTRVEPMERPTWWARMLGVG